MPERSIAHGSFTVDRTYPVPPSRLFAAWSQPEFKGKWYGDPEKEGAAEIFEFVPGGRERRSGVVGGDTRFVIDLRYYDIIDDERIVYACEVLINEVRVSVSIVSVQFAAQNGGTALSVTETGAFLDGHEKPADRRGGTEFVLDRLAALLRSEGVS